MSKVLTCLLITICFLGNQAALAHPGKVDKDGCHVCKKDCEKYGYKEGYWHCYSKKEDRKSTVFSSRDTYVEKVTDGDTNKVSLLPNGEKITVRILGIDCPESHKNAKCKRDGEQGRHGCDWQIPRGLKASKKAAELLKHKKVTLECVPSKRSGKCKKGAYGRALHYVRVEDGEDFGLVLVDSAWLTV